MYPMSAIVHTYTPALAPVFDSNLGLVAFDLLLVGQHGVTNALGGGKRLAHSNAFVRHAAPASRGNRKADSAESRPVTARQWLHVVNSTLYRPSERMWMSLCEPALLPLTTTEMSLRRLSEAQDYDRSNGLIGAGNPSPEGVSRLLRELVCQRLEQDFQLIAGTEPSPAHLPEVTVDATAPSPSVRARKLEEPLGQKHGTCYLCMGHEFHLLKPDYEGGRVVTEMRTRKLPPVPSFSYSYVVSGCESSSYEPHKAHFEARARNAQASQRFRWNTMDNMCSFGTYAGEEEKLARSLAEQHPHVLEEWMEPRVLAFCLLSRESPQRGRAPSAQDERVVPQAEGGAADGELIAAGGEGADAPVQSNPLAAELRPAGLSSGCSPADGIAPSPSSGATQAAATTPASSRSVAGVGAGVPAEPVALDLNAFAKFAQAIHPRIKLASQAVRISSAELDQSSPQSASPPERRSSNRASSPPHATGLQGGGGAGGNGGGGGRGGNVLVERLLSTGADGRELTTVVEMDGEVSKWRGWRICLKWRVSVGVTVKEIATFLERKATQANLQLVQVPVAGTGEHNGRAIGGPFAPPFQVPCPRELVPACLRALCSAPGPFDFALETEGKHGRFGRGARYVARSGIALVEVVASGFVWVHNSLSTSNDAQKVAASFELLAELRVLVSLVWQSSQTPVTLPSGDARPGDDGEAEAE
jgi:hypothetical protein